MNMLQIPKDILSIIKINLKINGKMLPDLLDLLTKYDISEQTKLNNLQYNDIFIFFTDDRSAFRFWIGQVHNVSDTTIVGNIHYISLSRPFEKPYYKNIHTVSFSKSERFTNLHLVNLGELLK